nr:hypothetical protein TetV2_00569 [Oceanusvirus sp.]
MPVTALHLFSDEEGAAPFHGHIVDNNLFHKASDPIFSDGLVSGVGEGGKLVYLGDLMDRYPYEIRLMQRMLAIPENDITLIAGNRDVNKLRLIDELRMKKIEGRTDTGGWDKYHPSGYPNFQTFEDVVNFAAQTERSWEFETISSERFQTWKNMETKKHETLQNKNATATERLALSVNDLMGVKNPVSVKMQEARAFMKDVPDVPEDVPDVPDVLGSLDTDEKKAVFVCVLYTILAGGYFIDTHAVLLKQLDGLYIRFLQRCKIMSLEQVGDTRVLVAHGGVPDLISNPIGLKEASGRENTVQQAIDSINTSFKTHITEFVNGKGNAESMEILYYYIGLSGPLQQNTAFGEDKFDYKNSPIVTRTRLNPTNRRALYASGGDGKIDYSHPIYATFDDQDDKKVIDYVVFGHTPQGNAPSIWTSAETVYAAIDVSNSRDDKSRVNEYSTCAIMSIYPDREMVVRGQAYDKNGQVFSYSNKKIDYERNPPVEISTERNESLLALFRFNVENKHVYQVTDPNSGFSILETTETTETTESQSEGGDAGIRSRTKIWSWTGMMALVTLIASGLPRLGIE